MKYYTSLQNDNRPLSYKEPVFLTRILTAHNSISQQQNDITSEAPDSHLLFSSFDMSDRLIMNSSEF